MDTTEILAQLRAERDRINQAVAAIEAITPDGFQSVRTRQSKAASMPQRRRMSAAGRKRISEAAKARWAERKKKATPAHRGMSAAARKKMSARMKARWAAKKKGNGA